MSAQNPPTLRYEPSLDGLRAVAILMVIAFHARAPFALGGYVGVDLFFVLSGYLITRICGDAPLSNLGAFYSRRARRLLPALLTMLATYLLVAPLIWPDGEHLRDAALAALYLSSYSFVHLDAPDILRHTWSLSVEVYFYLVWPFVVAFARGRNRLLLLILLYVLASAWRMHATGSLPWDSIYARADTHCTGLILGAAIACFDARRAPRWLLPMGLAGMCWFAYTLSWQDAAFPMLVQTMVEISAACCVLGAASGGGWIGRAGIAYLGKLSYGAYLWHYPVVRWCRDMGMLWDEQLLISGVAGFTLAAISYHTIESIFRHVRPAAETSYKRGRQTG